MSREGESSESQTGISAAQPKAPAGLKVVQYCQLIRGPHCTKMLGEHTKLVFGELLGMSQEKIARL